MSRSRVLLALVVLVVLLVPATALADHGQDVARGNYRTFSDLVSFSASSNANGTQADGHFKEVLQNFDPNIVIEGDVTCLLVVNNVATLGGEVTRVRPSGFFTGVRGFTLTVTDSGKFASAPDLASFVSLSGAPPAACTPITFQQPITEGEIIVHDSL
jgi:opacity protein-like surface antigen